MVTSRQTDFSIMHAAAHGNSDLAANPHEPATLTTMQETAIEALKTYQSGTDPKVLQPIENEILSIHGDTASSQALELRLVELLRGDLPHAAKDAICRMLRTFGTSASVPVLATLLADERLSHMARYALERIPAPEAGRAMIDALPKVTGKNKIGIITSLGVRSEEQSVPVLASLLGDRDAAIARSAALALGEHGSREAAKALLAGRRPPETLTCVADALVACAENLVASGAREDATSIYRKLVDGGFPASAASAAKNGLEKAAAGTGP